ncbi:MAG: hypothetical protein VZR00_10950 [Lachnospiraceae bacterium]|jgi:hypothetical protein|nr:hypothetical protein [Lachnospiraceae bacterium]MEE3462378.1 hypothetical protein [Lachnospiraceae bacterium]
METTIFIVAALAISIVWVIIKRMIYAGVYKGVNAAENAVKRAQEKKNPSRAESLADRYKVSENQNF